MKIVNVLNLFFLTATLIAILQTNILAARQPNILLIVSDDQGWNDVGYHNKQLRTPNIDKLAKSGVELDCHYVQPQCTPTRVALMTGRYPSRFGKHATAANNAQAFKIGTLTMAKMLKSQGYQTGLFGKWHLGSKPAWGPKHHGFDHSYGALTGATGVWDHRYRLGSPFTKTWHRNHKFIEEEGHTTDLVTDEAIRWIKKRNQDKPFFAYIPYLAVHTPLAEKDKKWFEINKHIKDPDRQHFAAYLSHLDDAVGRLVATLKEQNLLEDTLIIYTSDNGGIHRGYRGGNYPAPDPALKAGFSSNKPLRGGKTTVYEGGMRVPAFVHWKGNLTATKISNPMHVADWLPTLAALTGYTPKVDPKWDGKNILPLLEGKKLKAKERMLYWVWGGSRFALRDGHWKILRQGGKKNWEMYHLSNDPNEKKNLAKENPEKLKEMIQLFKSERKKDAVKKTTTKKPAKK